MRVVKADNTAIELGTLGNLPTVSMIDFSRRVTDDFGTTTVVKRSFAKRMSVRLSLPLANVDAVQKSLAGLRATSARWEADPDYAWLNFQGFYKDFDLDLAVPPTSYCSLTVEGLAEIEAGVDSGIDPAPTGMVSSLSVIQPVIVTEAVLVSSNVPENDYAAWAAGTTYAKGARVIKTATHRIYESAAAGNVGNDPAGLSGLWINVGPTNQRAMFDQALGTVTARAGSIIVVLSPGAIGALSLIDVIGASVRVQATGYDQTKAVTDAALNFLDMAGATGNITVTITGAGTVSVGTLILGKLALLGVTGASPNAGITDYSRKVTDDFGAVSVVERAWAKRMTTRALIKTSALDIVANRLASIRAMPALWIASDGTDSLTVYGFFKEFSIELDQNVSTLSLSIEGLSKAPPLPPLPDEDDPAVLTIAQKITLIATEAAREIAYQAKFSRMTALSISSTTLTTARANWLAFLAAITPDWNNTSVNSPVDRATFNNLNAAYETQLAASDNAISVEDAERAVVGAGTIDVNGTPWNAANGATNDTFVDTRNDNQPPSWYRANYALREVNEFKDGYYLAIPTTASIGSVFGSLITTVDYPDASGGQIKQRFTWGTYSAGLEYVRVSTGTTTWGPWKKNYNGFSTQTLLEVDPIAAGLVAQNAANIGDLQTTYGNTASSASSAAASEAARVLAVQAKDQAQTQAGIATGAAVSSSGSASSAAASEDASELNANAAQAYDVSAKAARDTALGHANASGISATQAAVSQTAAGNDAFAAHQDRLSADAANAGSLTNAGVALSAAASATDKAAQAQNSADVSASFNSGLSNKNANFSGWSGAANTAPNDWALAYNDAGQTVVKATGVIGGFAVDLTTPGSKNFELAQNLPVGTISAGWFVMELDIDLVSGNWAGAGMRFLVYDVAGTGLYSPTIVVNTDKESGTQSILGATPAAGHYRFRRLVNLSNPNVSRYYLGCDGPGFSAANSNPSRVILRKCGFRPATEAEIRDQTVLAPMEAVVTNHTSTLATQTGQIASQGAAITTQGAAITTQGTAITTLQGSSAIYDVVAAATGSTPAKVRLKAGVGGSVASIVSDQIDLQNYTGGAVVTAMVLSGGNALFGGDVNVGGAITVGTRRIPIALQSFNVSAVDGVAVSYGTTGVGLGSIPALTPDFSLFPALPAGQNYVFRADASTANGFTPRIKIASGGSPALQTSAAGAAFGTGPSFQVQKPTVADAVDGKYTFRLTGNMYGQYTSYGGGNYGDEEFIGYITFDFFFRPAGGVWTAAGQHTIEPTNYAGQEAYDRSLIVNFGTAIGQHVTDTEFGVSISDTSGVGVNTLTGITSVTYTSNAGVTETTATPSGFPVLTVKVNPNNA